MRGTDKTELCWWKIQRRNPVGHEGTALRRWGAWREVKACAGRMVKIGWNIDQRQEIERL